ncbi:TetR/AcrR family transcriptional regulator [Aliiruegeria sabulilitoris]|uniref:TetR/AcrR family transcriptional regulator n=1 Tax=Aliiruegeria sabulilitoris TaxID=1510458 RepID=UPI00082F648A|nr:TetR/AcrR family transcriptional regulator [Aliiruegeria sabulilitoris]
MAGLRERQKQDRQKRIVEEARALFLEQGYEATTIEGIAAAVGLSGVTVHNYYGTKAGVLLAIVAESDRKLLERMGAALSGDIDDLPELLLNFAAIVRNHAVTNLNKQIWRQVVAATIVDSESRFAKTYHELDHKLSLVLVREVERLQQDGRVSADVSPFALGKGLFHLQNTRFIQFVSSDEMTDEEAAEKLRSDVSALLHALPAHEAAE